MPLVLLVLLVLLLLMPAAGPPGPHGPHGPPGPPATRACRPVSVKEGALSAEAGLRYFEVLEASLISLGGPLCADSFASFQHFRQTAPFPATEPHGLKAQIPTPAGSPWTLKSAHAR